ncbi:hypothetical protein AKJ09_04790 [Labilithrix luteola]|uniref:Uncharacterized protein n=1 Tax=Labilithrix luteola TaxID=1391654 RepID=A0A0K1PXK2_9BACT|nr:hypothetical protein [Labilithrix luteola]AKU98126.1 hypothetical protein AKJ09_04790 [Labilithrix luteola]
MPSRSKTSFVALLLHVVAVMAACVMCAMPGAQVGAARGFSFARGPAALVTAPSSTQISAARPHPAIDLSEGRAERPRAPGSPHALPWALAPGSSIAIGDAGYELLEITRSLDVPSGRAERRHVSARGPPARA